MNRLLADATMVVHFGFLAYLVLGGFLAWRWPRTIVSHLAAVSWGILIVAFSLTCPLTPVEDHFRRAAGQDGLADDGFINTYIDGVIYPSEHVNLVRLLIGVTVAVSWAGLVQRRRQHQRRAQVAA